MRSPLAALPAALLLLVLPSAASAQADIEAVWSFDGGQVAVQPAAGGGFTGTVIRPTRFADCEHPVGELMWTRVSAQPDGSHWGGHQWFRVATCEPIAQPGNTAFRVLAQQDGTRLLRVCFAAPERLDLQPTIAADGTSANTTAGCRDSDFISPPAGKPRFRDVVVLPRQGRRGCARRGRFRIRLREPQGDAIESARVLVNGKRVRVVRGSARLKLRRLPRGRANVRVVARTVLGRTIRGGRSYRTCRT